MANLRPGRRSAGALESAVLGALWAADTPQTPAAILTSVGGGLAYNTVHTILTRLVDKGLVARTVHAGHRAYTPVLDAAQLAAQRMRRALEAGGDHTRVLQHFVTSLSSDEEQALRALLGHDRRDPTG